MNHTFKGVGGCVHMHIKLLLCRLIPLICIPTLNVDSEANDFS